MQLPEHIFRAYDIRGIIGEDLSEEIVSRIGLGYGTLMASEGRKKIAVGHDVRESSPIFAKALTEGLRDAGMDVTFLGQVPTPVTYYAVPHYDLEGCIMVTGSHNPINYNGLKITRDYWPIWGDEITKLREIAENAEPAAERGSVQNVDVIPDYLDEIAGKFQINSKLKVAYDCGNGTAGPIIEPLLDKFGVEKLGLYVEPDGTFPNHLPDPEVPKYMQDLCDLVKKEGADIAFGFDGDSDRVGLIDEKGFKRSADHIVLVMARYILEKEGSGKIIVDVKCSDFLMKDIAERGGTPIMWKTGHSIIKEKMREEKALLAGELSGHICVARDYYGFDDAFFAALFLLHIMSEKNISCSQLFEGIPETFYTPEVKIGVSEADKFGVVDKLVEHYRSEFGTDRVNTIDGVRATWPDGWALVRASNTTANLTVRVEGHTQEALRRICTDVCAALEPHPVKMDALLEFSGKPTPS
ncbi:MAG: phosphomannomutase/phosphoglucomutase [Planctomycetota bacterium]